MTIDFSKAPPGAEKYCERNGWFLKLDGKSVYWWNENTLTWRLLIKSAWGNHVWKNSVPIHIYPSVDETKNAAIDLSKYPAGAERWCTCNGEVLWLKLTGPFVQSFHETGRWFTPDDQAEAHDLFDAATPIYKDPALDPKWGESFTAMNQVVTSTGSDSYADNRSDGSTASYYELPPNATELQHLISYRNMNSQIGEIFRACYRYGMASHSDQLRDAKKILFYANAEVERLESQK